MILRLLVLPLSALRWWRAAPRGAYVVLEIDGVAGLLLIAYLPMGADNLGMLLHGLAPTAELLTLALHTDGERTFAWWPGELS